MGDIEPKQHPSLNLPKSNVSVRLSIINTTCDIVCPASGFVRPVLQGQEYLNLPTFCFHIKHPSGKEIMFDLGCRKDYWNFSPSTFNTIKAIIPGLIVKKNVDEILKEGGVDPGKIGSIVWSHWHWDHTGDPSFFPKSAELIVGPGFKENFMPGYPSKQDSPMLDTDFEGREVREIAFSDDFKIGKFQAHDFFGDGSFYILNVPGHAIGHVSGLARTTPDTFVFLGGDVCHFSGMFRPTQYKPLPETIPSDIPLDRNRFRLPCPCSIFTACHPNHSHARDSPFYKVTQDPKGWYFDSETAQHSVNKLAEFDADPNVFVALAHDEGLQEVVDWFPKGTMNEWKKKGWKNRSQWGFLNALPIDGKPAGKNFCTGLMKDGVWMRELDKFERGGKYTGAIA